MLLLAAHRLPELQQYQNILEQLFATLIGARWWAAEVVQGIGVDTFTQYIPGQTLRDGVALQQRQSALQQLEATPDCGNLPILSTALQDGQTPMEEQTEHLDLIPVTVLGSVDHLREQLQPDQMRRDQDGLADQLATLVGCQRMRDLHFPGEQSHALLERRLPGTDHLLYETQLQILSCCEHPLPTLHRRLHG